MKKYMKSFIFIVCLFCILPLLTINTKAAAPKKIILSRKQIVLYKGETKQVSVKSVKPKKASKQILWKSKNRKIATVTAKGVVKAKKVGATKITAISKKDSKIKAVIKVIVKSRPQKLEKECSYSAAFYNPILSWARVYKKGEDNPMLIYDKEDYKEMFNNLEAKGVSSNQIALLKELQATDFTKQSLVMALTCTGRGEKIEVQSIKTQRDSKGKLCGVIDIKHTKTIGDDVSVTAEGILKFMVIKMDKNDATMVDYFKIHHSR